MADRKDVSTDIHLLKRTRISVYVDEALPDILVVTFEFGVKIFKGVLLDSTKKNMPCGVPNLNPAFAATTKPNAGDDDTLYSVNQRYAYTDPSNAAAVAAKKKNVHISSKYKNNKMTVRLRPRQVLCSKCKGICNENSENVTRKRKPSETVLPTAASPLKRALPNAAPPTGAGPVTRSSAELAKKRPPPKRTLMPKAPVELPPLSGNVNKLNIDNNKRPLVIVSNLNLTNNNCDSKAIAAATAAAVAEQDVTHSIEQHSETTAHKLSDAKLKRILRKKRSVGSMEDLWDETVFEEAGKKNNNNPPDGQPPTSEQQQQQQQPLGTNTRTIKICYGPQGEGTVLKIPAQIENLNVVEDDLEENADEDSQKAARKAMKKARKEAKRKTVVVSPERTSPRYAVGASSPRYTVGSASPRHGLGNHSPRYITAAALEPNTPKKRKHKLKHKKKHREDKDRKHEKEKEGAKMQCELAPKEQCLTQKLSINLKRLSASYTAAQLTGVADRTDETSSDENSEQLPDFPPPNPPLMLRINAQTLNSAVGADGERLNVGDVVWGKIHGFPWWPGKVLTISNTDSQGPQAHVSWYGSATSSLIQCDQLSPYLDNFKTRYNKKKRGPYKDAIRQATTEARLHAEQKVSSPARNIMPVVPPALASPREINVIS